MNETLLTVRVWDLPTRCFHWSLAACVVGSVASAWIGGNAMAWHVRLGLAVFALLAFRLVWGVVGGRWSRFRRFAYGPAAFGRYVFRKSAPSDFHDVGHSPLGALSVFALLAILAVQVGTGLFADDEIADTGPLQPLVSDATSQALTRWHRGYGQWLVIGLVVLHLAAIAYYLAVKRRNLVAPMWSGDKRLAVPAPGSTDTWRTRLAALVLLAGCVAGVSWVATLGG